MAGDDFFVDRETIVGEEADVYEAIATLEYLGRPVTVTDLAGATGLPQQRVEALLHDLTERGLVTGASEDSESDFEPSNRGWSAAPEKANGPMR